MSTPPPDWLTSQSGVPSTNLVFTNSPGLSALMPTSDAAHLLFLASPLSFQPERSLPLNGTTGVGSAAVASGRASRTEAARARNIRNLRTCGRGGRRTHGDATGRETKRRATGTE